MQMMWCRWFLVPTAGLRPSGIANCIASHDSNWVHEADDAGGWYGEGATGGWEDEDDDAYDPDY